MNTEYRSIEWYWKPIETIWYGEMEENVVNPQSKIQGPKSKLENQASEIKKQNSKDKNPKFRNSYYQK